MTNRAIVRSANVPVSSHLYLTEVDEGTNSMSQKGVTRNRPVMARHFDDELDAIGHGSVGVYSQGSQCGIPKASEWL